jgi:DNA (cytosine-5)-methyltransferase 1
MPQDIDLFAGPGGWDEGVRPLGIAPLGIERDPAACATARAAGHWRLQADVTTLQPAAFGPVRGLIASPPCQGFSMAGKGRGRDDSAHLLKALDSLTGAWGQLEEAMAELHTSMTDDRSLLALEPLRWALELEPQWLAWEQVPTVAPLWEACAAVLRRRGYSVATGVLSAEQYGVPQTRQRAILVARNPRTADDLGPARLPAATHSRYYTRSPQRLDPGLLPVGVHGAGAGLGRGGPGGVPAPRGPGGQRDRGRGRIPGAGPAPGIASGARADGEGAQLAPDSEIRERHA